jgi:hypothetical protein
MTLEMTHLAMNVSESRLKERFHFMSISIIPKGFWSLERRSGRGMRIQTKSIEGKVQEEMERNV